MSKSIYLLIISLFIIDLSLFGFDKNHHKIISLDKNWEFTCILYNQFYPASIPGSVHMDLFRNKLIPDPFKAQNEKQLQWIDTLEWSYKTTFTKPNNLNVNDKLEIVFKGLDTYANIYLNDSLLFSANNMFVPWKVKIDPSELKNKNILCIRFQSPLKEEFKKYNNLPYELPGGARACTRKAAYHYGWDWAPKYITSGIWQDVEMHIWNTAKINDINYVIEKLDSSLAVINVQVNIESVKEFNGEVMLNPYNQDVNYLFENIRIKKGINNYDFKIEIDKPKLWWTRNLGEAFIYKFETKILSDKNILDSKKINIGLRTIELIREPDEYGESFYFKLNGIPVFMKGANYIPQSSFPGNVTDNQYKKIISDVVDANMNMLRVWGGGIYEKDIFYDLCDEAGILLWQDFMFANAMYPNDSSFLGNLKKEAVFQVKRLSNHPCLAVWCGNNEIDEAWHNWGWSNNYSKSDSAEIWDNYLDIFQDILPELVHTYSPNIPYTSSSPTFGRGNPRSCSEGDNHYWYVWHDAYDFDWYNKVTGRFMSEFGFQSFPGMQTISYFDTSLNKNIDSGIMLAHQKHDKGNILINHYMKDYYPFPENFEDFIYISQLLQAKAIRIGVLAQRRAKPFCMGSLYWQLNDCWPAISWSSIDYSGNWKALHYFAREDFKNIIINPYINNDTLKIYVVSDSLCDLKANLNLSLIDFYGKIRNQKSISFIIQKNTSKMIYKLAVSDILNDYKPNKHLLFLEMEHNNKILDSRIVYFVKPKLLDLLSFNIYTKFNYVSEGYELILKSDKLIKNLYIYLPYKGSWSENYFDLLPGQEKKVLFKTDENIEHIENQLKYKSLNYILKTDKSLSR